MTTETLPARIVRNVFEAEFTPFDRYGKIVEGVHWCPLRYCKETGKGAFFIKFDPGAKSLPHVHAHGEETVVLQGELIDGDGRVLRPGDAVSFAKGSRHSSHSETGCLLYVFMHGRNEAIEP